ncbi:MAG TPA: Ppx/GppA phosphatase family protein [Vicinamibacterales bacterium]|nr:Ppx/GppA phosphatase family protein [Vicinamibacterales bacterium]
MPERQGVSRSNPIAVIDIGSNSGRVVVFERDASSHLRLLAGSRAALRLVHDVDARQQLSETTMARTMAALRDFQAIASSAGARRIVAVATAAMRDATNGARFAERVRRELGIRIDIIEGRREARYGFAGAVRGLAVSNGLLFDLGGGSLQITRFSRRRLVETVSLPFGALRLSEKFLHSDPPSGKQLRRLRDHVRSRLAKAPVNRLTSGDRLVGTGGTLRNLAKIDRQSGHYPIRSLHAYELSVDHLADVVDRLASTKKKGRDEIPGLSAERADSIVGGAVVIQTVAEFVRADQILVSGQGLREGVALHLLNMVIGSPVSVKEASVTSLASRFDGWRPEAAARRCAVAAALQRALEPRAPASVVSAIDYAARVLDIGRTLDIVNRHEHVADILLSTELNGFAHPDLALVSAIVRRAGDRHADLSWLVHTGNRVNPSLVNRAAIILALADEIEARCLIGRRIVVDCEIDRSVTLSVRSLSSWLARDLDERFERAFGRPLVVRYDA